jgi:small redox-active disulfide protein 2
MNIKVVGGGCANCKKLLENVKQAIAETNIAATVDYVTDYAQMATLGVMRTPAVIIDGKIVSAGKVLTSSEIIALIKK